jgi:hypothetical protein
MPAMHTFSMAGRDRDKLKMTCPNCGKSGVAEVSTSDSMYAKIEGFSVDQFPTGFSLAKDGGGFQSKTEVKCSCGKIFKL